MALQTSFLGVLIHAKWVKCESTLQAMTSVFIFWNSSIRSENARISVGQTNVLKVTTKYESSLSVQFDWRAKSKNLLCEWDECVTHRFYLTGGFYSLHFNLPKSCLQVQWIKEEYNVFSSVIGERQLCEFAVNYGSSFKMWSRFRYWNKIASVI